MASPSNRRAIFVLLIIALTVIIHAVAGIYHIRLGGLLLGLLMVLIFKISWFIATAMTGAPKEPLFKKKGGKPTAGQQVDIRPSSHGPRVYRASSGDKNYYKTALKKPEEAKAPPKPRARPLPEVTWHEPPKPGIMKHMRAYMATRMPKTATTLVIILAFACLIIWAIVYHGGSRYYLETAKESDPRGWSRTTVYRVDKRTGKIWKIDGTTAEEVKILPGE